MNALVSTEQCKTTDGGSYDTQTQEEHEQSQLSNCP